MGRKYSKTEIVREIKHPEIEHIFVFPSKEEAARATAERIAEIINQKPNSSIVFATGETMIPVYSYLATSVDQDGVDFSKTTGFHLDEYFPCAPSEEHSFVKYLRKWVWGPLGITRFYEINGLAQNPRAEAARYNRLLKDHPVELAILGIGPWSPETNTGGHIGFNERGTPFTAETHLAKLDKATISRDRDERGQNTPDMAITLGIANILSAKNIFLVAYGRNKGKSLRESLLKHIHPLRPASALRLQGRKVSIFIDREAASQLSL
ncbi:MAG: glucosamine-6-phosphate deaminase [Patescibacteria group bacterium]